MKHLAVLPKFGQTATVYIRGPWYSYAMEFFKKINEVIIPKVLCEFMERTFSIVIPTLNKRPLVLNHLLGILYRSGNVSEVILINNTADENTLLLKSPKLRLYTPKENLFVNGSWNQGVSMAKGDYIILMNDDITIPENFVESLSRMPVESYGLIGIHPSSIKNENDLSPYETKDDRIVDTIERTWGYGIVLIFKKEYFVEIPSGMKIWCGDNFLFLIMAKNGHKPGALMTCIKTQMSATSDLPEFDSIKQHDLEFFRLHYHEYI